jgi:hypothetical protein
MPHEARFGVKEGVVAFIELAAVGAREQRRGGDGTSIFGRESRHRRGKLLWCCRVAATGAGLETKTKPEPLGSGYCLLSHGALEAQGAWLRGRWIVRGKAIKAIAGIRSHPSSVVGRSC